MKKLYAEMGLEPLFLSKDIADALDKTKLSPRSGALGPVAVTGYAEPSLVFLLGTATQLTDGETAAQAIVEGRPAPREGIIDAPLRIAVDVVKEGERLTLDFSRSAPACAGPVNISRATTVASAGARCASCSSSARSQTTSSVSRHFDTLR